MLLALAADCFIAPAMLSLIYGDRQGKKQGVNHYLMIGRVHSDDLFPEMIPRVVFSLLMVYIQTNADDANHLRLPLPVIKHPIFLSIPIEREVP